MMAIAAGAWVTHIHIQMWQVRRQARMELREVREALDDRVTHEELRKALAAMEMTEDR